MEKRRSQRTLIAPVPFVPFERNQKWRHFAEISEMPATGAVSACYADFKFAYANSDSKKRQRSTSLYPVLLRPLHSARKGR